tara:strand:- start:435 stop:812 length:378 start_codon:yes stop_codon:yes gene_type:complete
VALATFFVLKALEEKIVFFYSPTKLLEKNVRGEEYIRVGGLVQTDSIIYEEDGLNVIFSITDNKNVVKVFYIGILPDLFRENQGVVVEGNFNSSNNSFIAKKVLAKHDENYMPPEVKKAISGKSK